MSIKELLARSSGGGIYNGQVMTWLIFAGVAVIVVGLYIGNSYYQAHKRREVLKRKRQNPEPDVVEK